MSSVPPERAQFGWTLFHGTYVFFVAGLGFFIAQSSGPGAAIFLTVFLGFPAAAAIKLPGGNIGAIRHFLGRSPASGSRSSSRVRPNPSQPAVLPRKPLAHVMERSQSGKGAKLPTVSVIMPFRLPARFLGEAIRSALASDSVDVILYLVDDGSGMPLSVEIERTIRFDPRIRFITNEVNRGAYFARNLALQQVETDYVAFLDSDDEHTVDRLARQIELLERASGVVLTQCLAARWDSGLNKRVSDIRKAYISLVFRASLLQEVGFFDTVRYSGDAEFLGRVKELRGGNAIACIEEELYFLRSLPDSLTRIPGQEIFRELPDGTLERTASDSRIRYEENFKKWHKSRGFRSNPRLEFPQRFRPFALGDDEQEASPFMGQKIVGSMASFPGREAQLEIAVRSVYDQVDELHVYLNVYRAAPQFLMRPKIKIYLQPVGDLKDVGKIFGTMGVDGYVVLLDDDIEYPSDYVNRMVRKIEDHGRKAVIGVHGITYSRSRPSIIHDRKLCDFRQACNGGPVDALGTGTLAYHSDTISFCIEDFPVLGFADVWVARKCWASGVDMISIARPKSWLKALETEYSSRLYQINKKERRKSEEVFLKAMSDVLVLPVASHVD